MVPRNNSESVLVAGEESIVRDEGSEFWSEGRKPLRIRCCGNTCTGKVIEEYTLVPSVGAAKPPPRYRQQRLAKRRLKPQ